MKRRARGARLRPRLRAFNGPVPYPVGMTLERLEKLDSRRVRLLTSGLKARSAWTSVTGALDLGKITDQRFEGHPAWEPPKPADATRRGHSAATPHGPTDQGFET
jgi:hypothetical protein